MSTPPAVDDPIEGRQGHYAGAITRLVAFAIDVGAIWVVFTLVAAALAYSAQLILGHKVELTHYKTISGITYLVWSFVYFTYQWALAGKTVGMALVGIQVVSADGSPCRGRQAALRTLILPLSIVFFGLGLVGIVVAKDRHGFHDRVAHTAVVYSWDARAARLRWLARQEPARSATGGR